MSQTHPQLTPVIRPPQILTNPTLVLVYWGQFWIDNPAFQSVGNTFFLQFLRSHCNDGIEQYGVLPGKLWGTVNVVGQEVRKPPPDNGLDIAASFQNWFSRGLLPDPTTVQNPIYVFLFAPGLDNVPPGAGQINAQHPTGTYVRTDGSSVSYSFAYCQTPPIPAAGTDAMTWWETTGSSYTLLLSHEIWEASTDPNGQGWSDPGYPPGYTSEVCDICENQPARQYGRWQLSGFWSNAAGKCIAGNGNDWRSVGAPPQQVLGAPTVSQNANGTLVVFVAGAAGKLYQCSQGTPGGAFGNWTQVVPSSPAIAGPPTVATDNDGSLEVFGMQNGELWHTYQQGPNGIWFGGESLGGPKDGLIGRIGIGTKGPDANKYRALEAFGVGRDGQLHHIWQLGQAMGWSGWGDSLGAPGPGFASGDPRVATNADGRLEVFVLGKDGSVWHIWQTQPNNGWSGWASMGAPPVQIANGSPFVGRNLSDNRIEIFTTGADGAVYHQWQTAPNNGWSGWNLLVPSMAPSYIIRLDGLGATTNDQSTAIRLFAVASDGALWTIVQSPPGQGWDLWRCLGAPNNQTVNGDQIPAAWLTQENTVSVFVLGTDGNIWQLSQTSPAGAWGEQVS